jgi:hypothetical protein
MDLMKELKLNAPSRLYKHEAQRLLLSMKGMKKTYDNMTPITRARPGPFGPRPIQLEIVEDEELKIHVPKPLPKYVSERTKPIKKTILNEENVDVCFT